MPWKHSYFSHYWSLFLSRTNMNRNPMFTSSTLRLRPRCSSSRKWSASAATLPSTTPRRWFLIYCVNFVTTLSFLYGIRIKIEAKTQNELEYANLEDEWGLTFWTWYTYSLELLCRRFQFDLFVSQFIFDTWVRVNNRYGLVIPSVYCRGVNHPGNNHPHPPWLAIAHKANLSVQQMWALKYSLEIFLAGRSSVFHTVSLHLVLDPKGKSTNLIPWIATTYWKQYN